MFSVGRQLHGYRQGHQLLAASEQLSKSDQSLIDRLSDVAGPLRPREKFSPYLSAYPLPSGGKYVLARTWQDTFVSRAGCVRTLSLVINTDDWMRARNLTQFLTHLDVEALPSDADATTVEVLDGPAEALPPAPEFRGSELLEALFLEEAKPVAIFDAPGPDLIAVRLLTALWPSLRGRFSLSTFALSPRRLEGRDFDLVFTPRDARPKFTDWDGRRVDGRASQDARHRWTGSIVSRVFEQPIPQLLTDDELALFGEQDVEKDSGAALRIALLWDELRDKLERTPTAALGLLDIVNTGMVRDVAAVASIEPALANAVERAATGLAASEAWEFLGAMARKLHGHAMPAGARAVGQAVERLSAQEPARAVSLLIEPDAKAAIGDLLPSIIRGLGEAAPQRATDALLTAPASVLARLIAGGGTLARLVAENADLVTYLAASLPTLTPDLLETSSDAVLPYLVEDWQYPAAALLLSRLEASQLAEEAQRLGAANDFASRLIAEQLLARADELGATTVLRSALASLPQTARRDELLAKTLNPSVADAAWILRSPELSTAAQQGLLHRLLHQATDDQLAAIFADAQVGSDILGWIEQNAPDLLGRTLYAAPLSVEAFIRIGQAALSVVSNTVKPGIADQMLRRLLSISFEGDQIGLLRLLLSTVGGSLDGGWAAWAGLGRDIPGDIASRNLVAFAQATKPARDQIVHAIADVAWVLVDRRSIDLSMDATLALADLMMDAEKSAPAALLTAAGRLMPTLLRERRSPVTPILIIAFPAVYRELAKEDDVPDLLKFVPFFDWDRCKAARHELVAAFMTSTWPPGDLALIACRAGDVTKILRWTAKSYGGERYVDQIAEDLERLPKQCRTSVAKTISALRSDWTAKYDWRD